MVSKWAAMYLRTTRRTNRDGSRVEYYALAHNYRDPETGGVKAQILHSFGRADQLDREDLVRLCQSIARVCDVEVHDPHAVATGDQQGLFRSSVLPDGVRRIKTRHLGAIWVIEALWERLGIGRTIRRLCQGKGCTAPHERALFAMVANRLCDPHSKLGVWERWLETVHAPSCQGIKLDQMYRAMDALHEQASAIEEAVFFETADLLNLEVDLVFYDTTSCSFSIDDADDESEGIRMFGRPKEGGWAPMVVVALAVTRQGIPVRSWVFPGNTTDSTTVKRIKDDLRGWKLGRVLFVGDSGMNSVENRKELARACGRYLLAVRTGSVKEAKQDVLGRPGRYKKIADNLQAKEVVVGEGELRRRYILCFNPREAERQAAHRAVVIEELEAELARHRNHDATAKWAIELLASGRYGRYVKVDARKRIVLNRKAIREAKRMDGKWVLITNDDTLSIEDAATGYRAMLVIERCFRSLKRTQIQMTPMHHWLPRRIEAHVKICVLALLIQRVAELATGKPWPLVRRFLDQVQATEYRDDSHAFFETNELPDEAGRFLKSLEIPTPKTVIDIQELPENA